MEDEKLLKDLEGEETVSPVEEEIVSKEVEEPTTPTEPTVTSTEEQQPPIVEENGAIETSIKTFTQDDVDKLVGETRVKTREKTFNYIYNRYGVKNEEELDALVANAQRYDTLKEDSDAARSEWDKERSERDGRLSEMSEEIALMKSGVDANRYEDIKLILKGKGLEVTVDNIQSELETHPEWKKSEDTHEEPVMEEPVEKQSVPTTTTRITTLGNEPKPVPQLSEEEEAEKLFKMKFHN